MLKFLTRTLAFAPTLALLLSPLLLILLLLKVEAKKWKPLKGATLHIHALNVSRSPSDVSHIHLKGSSSSLVTRAHVGEKLSCYNSPSPLPTIEAMYRKVKSGNVLWLLLKFKQSKSDVLLVFVHLSLWSLVTRTNRDKTSKQLQTVRMSVL